MCDTAQALRHTSASAEKLTAGKITIGFQIQESSSSMTVLYQVSCVRQCSLSALSLTPQVMTAYLLQFGKPQKGAVNQQG